MKRGHGRREENTEVKEKRNQGGKGRGEKRIRREEEEENSKKKFNEEGNKGDGKKT